MLVEIWRRFVALLEWMAYRGQHTKTHPWFLLRNMKWSEHTGKFTCVSAVSRRSLPEGACGLLERERRPFQKPVSYFYTEQLHWAQISDFSYLFTTHNSVIRGRLQQQRCRQWPRPPKCLSGPSEHTQWHIDCSFMKWKGGGKDKDVHSYSLKEKLRHLGV